MRPTVRRVLLYACLGFALLGYGWVEGRAAEQTAEAVQQAQTVLRGSHAYLGRLRGDSLRIASLTRLGAFWADSERFWVRFADSVAADTLDSGVAQIPKLQQSNTALQYAVHACDSRASALDSARALLETDLALCKARGDTLERALGRLLTVRAPRWGFFVGPAILGQLDGSAHLGIAVGWGIRF